MRDRGSPAAPLPSASQTPDHPSAAGPPGLRLALVAPLRRTGHGSQVIKCPQTCWCCSGCRRHHRSATPPLRTRRLIPSSLTCCSTCPSVLPAARHGTAAAAAARAAAQAAAVAAAATSRATASSSGRGRCSAWRQQRTGCAGSWRPASAAGSSGGILGCAAQVRSFEWACFGIHRALRLPGGWADAMASRRCCLLAGSATPLPVFPAPTRFSRPHTMLGTAVSVTSVSALALGPGQLGAPALVAFAQALVSALLMNICIVGINQAGCAARCAACVGYPPESWLPRRLSLAGGPGR